MGRDYEAEAIHRFEKWSNTERGKMCLDLIPDSDGLKPSYKSSLMLAYIEGIEVGTTMVERLTATRIAVGVPQAMSPTCQNKSGPV